jgi:hypothetical protein
VDARIRILDSAHRYGISDDAIEHALDHPIRIDRLEDLLMIVGPDRTGRLIEVGMSNRDDDDPVVVHAMAPRRRFLRRR